MVSTAVKKRKIKKIVQGLAGMKQLQQEAIKQRKARKYIKTAGKIIRTGLWVAPLVIGLIGPIIDDGIDEQPGEDYDNDISDEIEAFSEFDPELISSVYEVFDQLDGLGDIMSNGVIDSIVDDIDLDDLSIDEINQAETVITVMYREMQLVVC